MIEKISTILNTIWLYLCWLYIECYAGLSTLIRPPVNNKTKRLLLLSYCLPPQFNSGTHRPLSFIKQGEKLSWKTVAITNPINQEITEAGKELESQIPSSVEVESFSSKFGPTSWALTPKIDGGFSNALSLVFSFIKVKTHEKPAVIVASCPPFYFAVAGYFISKIYRIPLVLDYRDEWTLCPFEFTSKTLFDKWFEKRCVKQASKLIYTTKTHKENHAKAFKIPDDKQFLVFNGWDEDFEYPSLAKNKNDCLIISYIGRLSEHVDLKPFITSLVRAILTSQIRQTITLRFIGEKSPQKLSELKALEKKYKLQVKIELIDNVKKSVALSYMNNSNYLLMLCNKELSSYIPGKLYDYIKIKVPIIAFGYKGEVSNIVDKLQNGVVIHEGDHKALSELLLSNYYIKSSSSIDKWLSTKSRAEQAKNLFKLIEQDLL